MIRNAGCRAIGGRPAMVALLPFLGPRLAVWPFEVAQEMAPARHPCFVLTFKIRGFPRATEVTGSIVSISPQRTGMN